ncbi:MAG: AraC family transcriptional regulator [Eubacterium sp.]|jgi:AraC family transcriptional regulator|nr:AraC family transcriptional regulator [Eubacterium sp.]
MSIQLIQQAICYMEEHIYENINYTEVARYVHMSSYNFHRTFSFIVGMTANEYLRKRRLTLAAIELQTTGLSVIDAAYKYGYQSPESFSKAFSRFHGSTPKQAKQKGAKLQLFNPLVIKIILEGGSIMDYRIEHKERQQFIALVQSFPNEIINDEKDHSISDFWSECYEKNLIEPMKLLRPEGKRDLYGLCSPVTDNENNFHYGIGIIVDENTDHMNLEQFTQNGYSFWETEPADYAVFKCFGSDGDCLSKTWSKFFKEFVPQTGYTQTDDTDYEIYFEHGERNLFCELWVPVKQV